MDKESGHQRPKPALQQVRITENQILLGEDRILLPSPETRGYANNDQKGIRSQWTPPGSNESSALLLRL
ncbi:MAG TPA: hypothetical protein VGH22_17290 [Candidatus Binatia bacterium]|jgi:hypothetical protein